MTPANSSATTVQFPHANAARVHRSNALTGATNAKRPALADLNASTNATGAVIRSKPSYSSSTSHTSTRRAFAMRCFTQADLPDPDEPHTTMIDAARVTSTRRAVIGRRLVFNGARQLHSRAENSGRDDLGVELNTEGHIREVFIQQLAIGRRERALFL